MRLSGWLAVIACVVAGAAHAAPADDVEMSWPDSPLACLQRGEQALQMPADSVAGVVRVRLSFERSDAPPQVEVFHNSGSMTLGPIVRRHVEQYRLPCLRAGAGPVVATQEFKFLPKGEQKIVWSTPRGEASQDLHDRAAACLKNEHSRVPDFPPEALRNGVQGNVLAQMRFEAPGTEPRVTILHDAGSKALGKSVAAFSRHYRVDCLGPDDYPLVTTQVFQFSLDGPRQLELRDVTLRQFVGAVNDLQSQRVRFDFNTMGCPFEVKVRLYQPYAPNRVGEVGDSDANRREFIEWLRGVSLQLPRKAARQVVGDQMAVAVPCGVLDLL